METEKKIVITGSRALSVAQEHLNTTPTLASAWPFRDVCGVAPPRKFVWLGG